MTQQFKSLRDLASLVDQFPEDEPQIGMAGGGQISVIARQSSLETGLSAAQLIARVRAMEGRLVELQRQDREAAEGMARDADNYDALRAAVDQAQANVGYAGGQLKLAEQLVSEALTDEARAEYEVYAAICADALEKTEHELEAARAGVSDFEQGHDVERLGAVRRRLRGEEERRVVQLRLERNAQAAYRAAARARRDHGRSPAEALGALAGLDLESVGDDVTRQLYAYFMKAGARVFEGALVSSFGGGRALIVRPAGRGDRYEVLAELGMGAGYAPGSVVSGAQAGRFRELRG